VNRKVRKFTIDWKHAVGEVFLIVVGVLVALAVNNWNTDRQDRQTELSLLQELRAALTADLDVLKGAETGFQSRKQKIEALRDHVGRAEPYAESLNADFGIVLGIWPIHFNRSPYEVLKAKGLNLVSNDSLRLKVVHVYDQVYADYQESQEDDRNVIFEVVRPYYLTAFRNIRFQETATPINYESIVRDQLFRNILEYRLRSLEANSIDPVETAIRNVSSLLHDLSDEIDRLR